MSVPRDLGLQTVGDDVRLKSTPVRELQKLRQSRYKLKSTRLVEGTTRLTNPRAKGDTVEIVAKFRARNAENFGLRVRTGTDSAPRSATTSTAVASTSTAPSPGTSASARASPAWSSRR